MTTVREETEKKLVVKLRAFGVAGALTDELCPGLGISTGTLRNALTRLEKRGVISSHLHPSPTANKRRRWYMADKRPAKAPAAKWVTSGFKKPEAKKSDHVTIINRGVKAKVLPGYTHNHRYQVADGASVHGAGFAALGVGRYLEAA